MSRPNGPRTVFVLVEASPQEATLEFAAKQLGVSLEAIDRGFGLTPVDRERGLYSALVREDALPPGFADRKPFRGPFANPQIEY